MSSTQKQDLGDFLKSSHYQCCSPNSVLCCSPDYYSTKKLIKTNMQAAAKKSTSWKQAGYCSASERLETSTKLPQPPKTVCAGCGHLGVSHRDVFLTAALKTENTSIGMRSSQINWNHFRKKLVALKTTGKQVWTLQKLAKYSSSMDIKNHCTWERKQLKQLYIHNNVLGQVTIQLWPFILSRLYTLFCLFVLAMDNLLSFTISALLAWHTRKNVHPFLWFFFSFQIQNFVLAAIQGIHNNTWVPSAYIGGM